MYPWIPWELVTDPIRSMKHTLWTTCTGEIMVPLSVLKYIYRTWNSTVCSRENSYCSWKTYNRCLPWQWEMKQWDCALLTLLLFHELDCLVEVVWEEVQGQPPWFASWQQAEEVLGTCYFQAQLATCSPLETPVCPHSQQHLTQEGCHWGLPATYSVQEYVIIVPFTATIFCIQIVNL